MSPLYEGPERHRTGVREDCPLSRLWPADQGPAAGKPLQQASPVGAPVRWSGTEQNGEATPDAARPLPAGMPPMPPTGGTLEFLDGNVDAARMPSALAHAFQGLNVTDMFLGNEKESVFSLLGGEQRLGELTIHHQHFFIVKSGVTRVTLTTQRLLYTATRVFSPVYWLLLVLFPPLIFYYVARLSRNWNIALPLESIDSVKKRYRPNWLLFVLAIIVGYFIAGFCSAIVAMVFHRAHRASAAGRIFGGGSRRQRTGAGIGGARSADHVAGDAHGEFRRPQPRRHRRSHWVQRRGYGSFRGEVRRLLSKTACPDGARPNRAVLRAFVGVLALVGMP